MLARSSKVTGEKRPGVAEEETTGLEEEAVEGGSGVDSGCSVCDSGTSNSLDDNKTDVNGGGGGSKNGSDCHRSVSGLSCRGGTLRLLKGLVEGPIGRVAARVHRWGTAGGVNPSAPSARGECPDGEGTPPRNVLDATKNRRLMGANLTKQSRVSFLGGETLLSFRCEVDRVASRYDAFFIVFCTLFLSLDRTFILFYKIGDIISS